MKKGDRIIWDSGFGYEIGYFIEDAEKQMYNSYKIELITGIVQEETLISKDEIIPYTKENQNRMKVRYKYDKSFSEAF
jgi:hypothetical protein